MLVDGDTGYGDVKNVTHTIEGYEAMGASAIFMEDQVAPKRCGHMAGKDVIPAAEMVAKIKAAVGARRSKDFFIIARTDARAVHGLDEALRRGEQYLEAGADGIFIEAPQTREGARDASARAFKGVPQIANMLEGGGQTPVLPPSELKAMGFTMAAYPTTLIFRVARTIERALADIKAGRPAEQRRRELRRVQGHHQLRRMGAYRGQHTRRAGRRHEAYRGIRAGVGAGLALATDAHAQTKVRLAVGGKPALFYLPLTVTERLGYFKDEGLDVEISDLRRRRAGACRR